jgi:hypothetical protein
VGASRSSSAATGAVRARSSTPTADGRRSALLTAKLGALVRGCFGQVDAVALPFPAGAALRDGGRAWILIDERPESAVGPAMAWARQQHVGELHLLTDDAPGLVSRRASAFADPPQVWWVQGTDLHRAEPEPLPPRPTAIDAPELVRLLEGSGLEVVVGYGYLAGELRGLEVARVVLGDDGAPRLDVGVGQADRELTAMLHAGLSPDAALDRVIRIVGEHRCAGAPAHPLNRLVPERWLRSVLEDDPARVGLTSLRAAPSPTPRAGLMERGIAPATGVRADGTDVVVVCSVGVDLDLVPSAADARAALAPRAPLLLVVPERDVHPVTTALAQALREPATVVPVAGDWRTFAQR